MHNSLSKRSVIDPCVIGRVNCSCNFRVEVGFHQQGFRDSRLLELYAFLTIDDQGFFQSRQVLLMDRKHELALLAEVHRLIDGIFQLIDDRRVVASALTCQLPERRSHRVRPAMECEHPERSL